MGTDGQVRYSVDSAMWHFTRGAGIVVAAGALAFSLSGRPLPARSTQGPEPGLRLVAESERTLSRVVLGLSANVTRHFLLPETTASVGERDRPRLASLRRQLYWLDFELERGQIFRYAPPQTRFFLAVPDARTAEGSLGDEEKLFRRYLKERVGWSEAQIRHRVRFFTVRQPIPFPQDMAEAIGYDDRGRLVLALGLDCDERYREPVERLVAQYPGDFALRAMPGLNTEGGDLALVRRADGRLRLLVGRNRVLRYLETRYGRPMEGVPLSPAQIEEARAAYRNAFFGLEIVILGEDGLRDPRLANPELFHLDMMASVMSGAVGTVAFVPTFASNPADALSHDPLTEEMVRRLQAEYDRAARQLLALRYRVARLPFADHPVRSPVNAAKFLDPATRQFHVLLGRYPYHFDLPDRRNPQRDLQRVFQDLDDAVMAWRQRPTAAAWSAVEAALGNAWRGLDRAAASPNPMFEQEKEVYEKNGVTVLAVPIFPTGEGGIHCIVLE